MASIVGGVCWREDVGALMVGVGVAQKSFDQLWVSHAAKRECKAMARDLPRPLLFTP
jgi:hypothetical protein